MSGIVSRFDVQLYDPTVEYRYREVVKTVRTAGGVNIPSYFVRLKTGGAGFAPTDTSWWTNYEDVNLANVWMPSLTSSLRIGFANATAQFKNGVFWSQPLGINSVKSGFECVWDHYNDHATKSLLSFLEFKGGKDPILFSHPSLLISHEYFTCENFGVAFEMPGINIIKAQFSPCYNIYQ